MYVLKVLLKLLARIDYGRNRGALRSNTMDDLKRKKFKRSVLSDHGILSILL